MNMTSPHPTLRHWLHHPAREACWQRKGHLCRQRPKTRPGQATTQNQTPNPTRSLRNNSTHFFQLTLNQNRCRSASRPGPHFSTRQSHPQGLDRAKRPKKIHLYGPPELKDRITCWNQQGQHGLFAGARRYLRLVRSLVLNQTPYIDPRARSSLASSEDPAGAALQTWEVLLRKWRTIPGGLALLCDEACPLGLWRRVVMESRSIHLPLRPS